MIQLTNEMILADLSPENSFLSLHAEQYTTVAFIFLALTIILFLFTKKKGVLIGGAISTVIFFAFAFKYNNEYDYTTYAIENNTWTVEVVNVLEKEHKVEYSNNHRKLRINRYYYLYLQNYGKVSVDNKIYSNIEKGESLYIILLEDEDGKKHLAEPMYSLKEYTYNKK